MGGFMKNIGTNLGRTIVFAALLLSFATLRASAQSQSATGADASSLQNNAAQVSQSPRIPARIPQSVDEANRVTLRGNVHPLARTEFDRGAVSDSQLATH